MSKTVLLVTILILFTSASLVTATQNSKPGSVLYPVKQSIEQLRIKIIGEISKSDPTKIAIPKNGKEKKPISPAVDEYPQYGHAQNYSWIAGKVEVVEIEGGCIFVIFSEQGTQENYFGRFTIQPQELAKEHSLKKGDFIVLKGKAGKPKFSMACPTNRYETEEILLNTRYSNSSKQ